MPSENHDLKDEHIVLADSITHVIACPQNPQVAVSGSHGGLAAAIFAAQKKVKAAIFNDAGVGKDRAGVAGLDILDDRGILAAAVDAFSAKIGLAEETWQGVISQANRLAAQAGVKPRQKASVAARLMARAPWQEAPTGELAELEEKVTVVYTAPGGRRIVTLDSNSQVTPEYKNDVIMTGSHGGLVGDQPAVKHPVLAAFYNDAGVGKDQAGISRLLWLEEHGIIGVTVASSSARIGVGLDTYQSGVISHLNRLGQGEGLRVGMPASEAARLILDYNNSG